MDYKNKTDNLSNYIALKLQIIDIYLDPSINSGRQKETFVGYITISTSQPAGRLRLINLSIV
jgi:hypothetical protein